MCEEKKRLVADYLERAQAMAIQLELFLDSVEENPDLDSSAGWYRVEQARIHCEIARLALGTHTSDHGC